MLIIGLDGATFDLLDPWLAEGWLPTLASICQRGTKGELASTLPPITAPAWSTFMTGKAPATHGIYDFFVSDPHNLDQYRLVNSTDIQARTIWEQFSAAGKSVGVLNVPVTHPPRPVNGYMVPGLLSPDEGHTTYPPNLLDDIEPMLGTYRVTPQVAYHPDNIQPFIDDLVELTQRQIDYACHFAQTHPTNIMMVHFFATDSMQHRLWHVLSPAHPWHTAALGAQFGHTVRDLFRQIDAGIARLLALLPADTTVLVMSDHGFGPQHQTINLNLILAEAGLLYFKPSIGLTLRRQMGKRHITTAIAQRLWQREKLLSFADVDWAKTRAFSLGHMGQVTINLQGRQLQGCVHADDYAAICTEVETALQTVCHPVSDTILPVRVQRAGKTPPLQGPDLHVCVDGYRTLAYPLFSADNHPITTQRLGDSGHHRANGIFMACGQNIRQQPNLSGARLVDLAPTLLHLHKLPVPDDMDGAVLTDLFTPDYMAQHPVQFAPAVAYVGTDSAELTQSQSTTLAAQLRALGYLDQ